MLRSINVSATNKEFYRFGGLILARDLAACSGLSELVREYMPDCTGGKARNSKKFSDLVLGLAAGADCLDDMQELEKDAGFREICGFVYSAKTYGDFLRGFSSWQCN